MVTIEDKFTNEEELDQWYKTFLEGLARCGLTYGPDSEQLEMKSQDNLEMAALALDTVYRSVYFYVMGMEIIDDGDFHTSTTSWRSSKAKAINQIDDWYKTIIDGLSKCAATVVDIFDMDSFDEHGGDFYRSAMETLADLKIDMYSLIEPGKVAELTTFDQMFLRYIHE